MNFDLIHSFFYFLGTVSGELTKTTIELVFFMIVSYMIASEYARHKRKEYLFLVIGFGTMSFIKAVSVYTLANVVFVGAVSNFWIANTIENFAEIAALFLIANAFVYPIIRQQKLNTSRFILKNFLMLFGISFVFSLVVLSIIDLSGGNLINFWSNTSINVAEIVVLIYYAAYLMSTSNYRLRYRGNIIAALVIYSITPVINLINILLYNNDNTSLFVASHPFPFASIFIFTQVIYLKLSDKARLLDRLKKSEQLYAHEKEVSKLKDSFISTVSHELKTPLTSMKLYVGLLKEKKLGPVKTKQKKALNIVNEECDRLNNLITDILDLSKFDAQKAKLNKTEFEINNVLTNDMYLESAKKQGILVELDFPDSMVVYADEERFKQVFINLFNNAIKFTPEGGKIVLGAKERIKHWEFSVQDSGKGIDEKHLPNLFNRFYQAENVMTRTQGGFGLGLAIVKSIVDMHEGKIGVESEINRGTRFSILFPKRKIENSNIELKK